MDDDGLKLLKEFVEAGIRDDLDLSYCRYCIRCPDESHEPGCTWLRARAYLRDQGVEVKDGES